MKERPEKRSRVAVTRLTEKEFYELLKAAERFHMSFSDFLRISALNFARNDFEN